MNAIEPVQHESTAKDSDGAMTTPRDGMEQSDGSWIQMIATVAPLGAAFVAEAISRFTQAEPGTPTPADPILHGIAHAIDRARSAHLTPPGEISELARSSYEFTRAVVAAADRQRHPVPPEQRELLAEYVTIAILAGVGTRTLEIAIEDICPY